MVRDDCPQAQNRQPPWNMGVLLDGYLYVLSNDEHKLHKLSCTESNAVLIGCTNTHTYVFYDEELELVNGVEVKLEKSIDLTPATSGHQMIIAGNYLAVTSWNDYHYFQRYDLQLIDQDLEVVAQWLNTDMKGLDAICYDGNYLYVMGYQDFLIFDLDLNRLRDSYIGGNDYSSMVLVDGVMYAVEWWYQTVSKIIPSVQTNSYISLSREIESQYNNIVYWKNYLFTFGYSYKTYPYDICKLDKALAVQKKIYYGFTIAPLIVLGTNYMFILDNTSKLFRINENLNISNMKTTNLIGLASLI